MTGKDCLYTSGFVVMEGAMSFADKPIQRNVTMLRSENKTIRGVSNYVTRFGGAYEV